jgi:ribonuclease Z
MASNLTVPVHPSGAPTKLANAVIKDHFHPLLENKQKDGSIFVQQSNETRAKFAEARRMVRDAKQSMGEDPGRPGDDVVVVPLGTGSAIPGQYRTGESSHSSPTSTPS